MNIIFEQDILNFNNSNLQLDDDLHIVDDDYCIFRTNCIEEREAEKFFINWILESEAKYNGFVSLISNDQVIQTNFSNIIQFLPPYSKVLSLPKNSIRPGLIHRFLFIFDFIVNEIDRKYVLHFLKMYLSFSLGDNCSLTNKPIYSILVSMYFTKNKNILPNEDFNKITSLDELREFVKLNNKK
jgi:hypothetical protein